MNNIFENAYLGKAYKTRNGRKAIYVKDTMMHRVFVHELALEDGFITCSKHGKIQVTDHELDIVSEWEEEIDEEYLDDLAYDYNEERQPNYWWEDDCTVCVCEASEVRRAFKAGYKAAMKGEQDMKEQSNRYDYVDLGLPSGTLWATCNVGANNPWEYGKYFAWGETEGYYDNEEHDFSWKSYKWCNGTYDTLTKYNNKSKYGENPDNKFILDPEDDAAHVNMGGDWRMPTEGDFEELIKYTNYLWIEDYRGTGVNGRLYTSKKDTSKSIFIPTSGFRCDSSVYCQGSDADLWGSTLYMHIPGRAWELYFDSDGYGICYYYRYCGFCVRGVTKK